MSRLGAYVSASTANPLGHRPHSFALKSPESVNPTLTGYYPANYFVPTPLNIHMQPQPNIYDGATFVAPPGMGQDFDIGGFISDNSTLLMGLAVLGVLWYIMREPRRGRRR
jgi:hypothetical protein